MNEYMIEVENVSKRYKLGQIGGTTLRDEFQRKRAMRRGEEDPTKKIGSKNYKSGETFMALDGVTFKVKKGERVGIIGHNGAGKSTLLKLLSRVTAPTGGMIGLNGRVASMLEVGTGFHAELTGRENIYMNGAILGMTKNEIDKKIENIIDFSECRQFIDTPVKRYSSGMYVKLAFSVAAHLDSEIMIMDEVLAVGDMAFQKKCLEKMSDVSHKDGRTILYVSHNMNTIRQLCDRVIVLNHGKIIYDGERENGIRLYMEGNVQDEVGLKIDLTKLHHKYGYVKNCLSMKCIEILDKQSTDFYNSETLHFCLHTEVMQRAMGFGLRMSFFTQDGEPVMTSFSDSLCCENIGAQLFDIKVDLSPLRENTYYISLGFFYLNTTSYPSSIDWIERAFRIKVVKNPEATDTFLWDSVHYGSINMPILTVKELQNSNVQ